jgi:hypothetical protein
MIILKRVSDDKGIKEVEFFIEIPKYTESVEPGVLDIQTYKIRDDWYACMEWIERKPNGRVYYVAVPKIPIHEFFINFCIDDYGNDVSHLQLDRDCVYLQYAKIKVRNPNINSSCKFEKVSPYKYITALLHEPVYDMTLDEIEKKLGKKIRIINNDKDK